MSEHEDRDVDMRLADWVDGTMSDRDRERFVAELRVSPQLRAELADYERTVGAVRQALQEPAPHADAIAARVAGQVLSRLQAAPPRAAARSWSAGRLWLGVVAAAALLAFAVWLDRWSASTGTDGVDVDLVARDGGAADAPMVGAVPEVPEASVPEASPEAQLPEAQAPRLMRLEQPNSSKEVGAGAAEPEAQEQARLAKAASGADGRGAAVREQARSADPLRVEPPALGEEKTVRDEKSVPTDKVAPSEAAVPNEKVVAPSGEAERRGNASRKGHAEPEPEVSDLKEQAFDSNQWNSAVGLGGGKSGDAADRAKQAAEGGEQPASKKKLEVPAIGEVDPAAPQVQAGASQAQIEQRVAGAGTEMLPQIVLRSADVATKSDRDEEGLGRGGNTADRAARRAQSVAFLSAQLDSLAEERVAAQAPSKDKSATDKSATDKSATDERQAGRMRTAGAGEASPPHGKWTRVSPEPDSVRTVTTGSDDFYLGSARRSDPPAPPVERVWVVEGSREEIQAVLRELAVFAQQRQLDLIQGEVAVASLGQQPEIEPQAFGARYPAQTRRPAAPSPAGPATGGPAGPPTPGGGRGGPTTPGRAGPTTGGPGGPAAPAAPGAPPKPVVVPGAESATDPAAPRMRIVVRLQLGAAPVQNSAPVQKGR
ncbi:MAG: hypothetical protein KDC48_01650 [Planctomycetes bacterium]|nr:hypothetical protein [Planctomycetota bacterium]